MTQCVACRVCGSSSLVEVLDLGNQEFTGIFPLKEDPKVPSGYLRLMHCSDCGLGQLGDSYPSEQLYGDNYGYRSGLNSSMVAHLKRIANRAASLVDLKANDIVVDIGSNDCTLLNSYEIVGLKRVGIDPTIQKFSSYYPLDVTMIPNFFSKEKYFEKISKKAKVITSIAMLYDLENPVQFAKDVFEILDNDGVWIFEQSYAKWMLETGAYDTICHEHLEYYTLRTLERILDEANLKILEATTNSTNGGSISVIASKKQNNRFQICPSVNWILENEDKAGINSIESWQIFSEKSSQKMHELGSLLEHISSKGFSLAGLGASTKGNVLLQSMRLTNEILPIIGDVNPYKYGRVTPGTQIPITSEKEVIASNPDFILILPWHFKNTFLTNLDLYLASGGKLIFPLPDVEVVGF